MTEARTPGLQANADSPKVRTELLAGLTTFLSMAYILALYPGFMSKIGLPAGGADAVATSAGRCWGPPPPRPKSNPPRAFWRAAGPD